MQTNPPLVLNAAAPSQFIIRGFVLLYVMLKQTDPIHTRRLIHSLAINPSIAIALDRAICGFKFLLVCQLLLVRNSEAIDAQVVADTVDNQESPSEVDD